MVLGHSKCTEHLPIWYFVVTWLSNSWLKPHCAASVLVDHFLIVPLCRSKSTWVITDQGHFGHMIQYFLNVPTIFPQCTELGSASYIVWDILKELNLFLPRKVLVHWTWNYNVFNKYWVSKQGSVPSVTCWTEWADEMVWNKCGEVDKIRPWKIMIVSVKKIKAKRTRKMPVCDTW